VSRIFGFEVTARDGGARRGLLRLAHGVVETPAFMPVGTQAAVKSVSLDQLGALGVEIVLANTYHLHVRPGDDLIGRAGGLHAFMGWDRPILTDSGGYQVFSLAGRRQITEAGVVFRSHLDGRRLELTPEMVVDVQARLGADVAMTFDECPEWPASHAEVEASMTRTLRWARRGRDRFVEVVSGRVPGVEPVTRGQVQFGVVQGGTFKDLRDRSAAETRAIGFEAYAIGGLSVGEPAEVLDDIVAHTTRQLPEDRPRYLMGVGTPADLANAVARGVDLFDCVLPTRNARNGQLFTSQGVLNIKNARYAEDGAPPDPACRCPTCRRHSRAYLRHLFVAGEMTAATLNTVHNLYFYLDTMREFRKAIVFGTFDETKRRLLENYSRRLPPCS
jgi:queuine tRNA-ribosyltransferase